MSYNTEKSSHLPQPYVANNASIYGEEETMNLKDFVIGALVGGIVGAAAGLLLAPKAGRELRSEVATQAVTLKDKSVELSSTAKEKTAQFSHTIKEQSSNFVDKVKAKTQKTPTVFDDGTVSYEGEEPLEELVTTDSGEGFEAVEDMSEVSRPSSI